MPRGDGYGGRDAARWVAAVLATYGDVCHLCHHQGAESADHLKPRRDRPELMYVVANGRPAHFKPCPSCGKRCNTSRGARPLIAAPAVDAIEFFDRSGTP